MYIRYRDISTCAQLAAFVEEMGMLPLLRWGATGWSAQEQMNKKCEYVKLPDGGWAWPLWEWKGHVLRETGCAYGRFFRGRAGFVSKKFWPDVCNWQRSRDKYLTVGSVEEMILAAVREHGSITTRDLKAVCGFTGTKLSGKFDTYLAHLEKTGYVVTEDFVYPISKQGKPYGWGWSLLTTPELLYGKEECRATCTPEESYGRLQTHLHKLLPDTDDSFAEYVFG